MLLEKCGLDDSITVRPVVGIDGGAKKRGSWDDFFQGIDGGIIWFKSSRFWHLFWNCKPVTCRWHHCDFVGFFFGIWDAKSKWNNDSSNLWWYGMIEFHYSVVILVIQDKVAGWKPIWC